MEGVWRVKAEAGRRVKFAEEARGFGLIDGEWNGRSGVWTTLIH